MTIHSSDSPLYAGLTALSNPFCLSGMIQQTVLNTREHIFGQKPEDNFDHGNNAPTIFLVQGFLCAPIIMETLGKVFSEHMNVVYASGISKFNAGDIELSSRIIKNQIEELLSKHEHNGDLHILGHSLGGLIAINALAIDVNVRVNRLITCGTPFYGTPHSEVLKHVSVACEQMNQSWGYLKGKDISETVSALETHISMNDNVVPPESQTCPDDFVVAESYKHPGYQHTDFILGKKAEKFAKGIIERL